MSNILNYVEANGEARLFISEKIHMGDVESSEDIFEFVNSKFLTVEDGEVYLREKQNIQARIAENGWLEIKFEDNTSAFDVAFDIFEEYDKHFKIQGRKMSSENEKTLESIDAFDDVLKREHFKDFNCTTCGEEYTSFEQEVETTCGFCLEKILNNEGEI